MDGLSTLGTIIGGLGGLAVAGFSGFFLARRRMSRDGVELVKDRSEINIIEQLEKQREAAIVERDAAQAQKALIEQEKAVLVKDLMETQIKIKDMSEHIELLEELTSRLEKSLNNAAKTMREVARQAKEGAGK